MSRIAIIGSFASILVAVTLAPPAFAAFAGDCLADADCGSGYACIITEVAIDGTGVGGSAGAGGAPAVRPEGECVRERPPCSTDADCSERYTCRFDDSVLACTEGGDCPEPPADPPISGQCAGEPMTCSADGDCPLGSTCDDQICTLAALGCTDDDACPSDHECVLTATWCYIYTCTESEGCATRTECATTSVDGWCFPKAVACSSDADCSGGWLCYDTPDRDMPDTWAGVDQGCLPAGVVGAIEGYVEMAGAAVSYQENSGSAGAPATSGTDGGGPSSNPAAAAESSAGERGCAVSNAGAAGGTGRWLMVAAGLVMGVRRARRRAR